VTTATSKAITGLSPTTAYAFTVRARDAAANWSGQTAPLSVTTLPDTTVPTTPASLTPTTVTISSFLFRWSASTDNVGVTGYEVFRDGVSLGLVAAPATSLSVTGLALSTPYVMTVRARDAAGNSPRSAQPAPSRRSPTRHRPAFPPGSSPAQPRSTALPSVGMLRRTTSALPPTRSSAARFPWGLSRLRPPRSCSRAWRPIPVIPCVSALVTPPANGPPRASPSWFARSPIRPIRSSPAGSPPARSP